MTGRPAWPARRGAGTPVRRSAPGTRGSRLRVSRPAERQPDPDLGRSPGGDQIDPGGAAVQRGHDLKPQDDLAVVPRWHPAVAAGGVPVAAAVAYPQRWQRPDSPAVGPVVLWRDAGDQRMHDGLRSAVAPPANRRVG